METKRRVALLMGTSLAYHRELTQGIAQFNREHSHWVIRFEGLRMVDPPPKWLRNWKGDGILVYVANWRMAKVVGQAGVPAIAFRWAVATPGIPAISTDHYAVAAMAAEHLRERGFRYFAACALPRGQHPPLDQRVDAFVAAIQGYGFCCEVFETEPNRTWEQEQQQIAGWLKSLPKPVGVMGCNDERGVQLLNACRQAGLDVPDQVAVLGVGNDDCLCSLAHPPLSSIDLAPHRIGYEAAALLERMMAGERVPPEEILIPPRAVVTRLSTDVLATDDKVVARVVAFIRDHACEGIHLSDVLANVNMTRWMLEPRVKRVLGRTMYQEIQRVQMEQVKHLLTQTDLPIKQIAAQTGFHYVPYLTRAFGRIVSQTPAQYRKQLRRQAGPNNNSQVAHNSPTRLDSIRMQP
ncbi:MAG: DNA-binding transcriptional regulator [Verrucomicrobiota bacterium]